jgi:hypothetical protein
VSVSVSVSISSSIEPLRKRIQPLSPDPPSPDASGLPRAPNRFEATDVMARLFASGRGAQRS